MPEKKCDSSVDRLRCVTLYSISISTFATLACVIAVPLFCNYLQSMNALMQNELEFCKSRSVGIWKEVTKTQVLLLLVFDCVFKECMYIDLYFFLKYLEFFSNLLHSFNTLSKFRGFKKTTTGEQRKKPQNAVVADILHKVQRVHLVQMDETVKTAFRGLQEEMA